MIGIYSYAYFIQGENLIQFYDELLWFILSIFSVKLCCSVVIVLLVESIVSIVRWVFELYLWLSYWVIELIECILCLMIYLLQS